jgi:hypothetical protein
MTYLAHPHNELVLETELEPRTLASVSGTPSFFSTGEVRASSDSGPLVAGVSSLSGEASYQIHKVRLQVFVPYQLPTHRYFIWLAVSL